MDANKNKIQIEAIAFQSIFRGVENIICVELFFLVQFVPGMDSKRNTDQVQHDLVEQTLVVFMK